MNKYEIILYWSEEDKVFIAEIPELRGCAAHGETHETALANAKEAIRLWLDTAREFGDGQKCNRTPARAVHHRRFEAGLSRCELPNPPARAYGPEKRG